MKPQSAGTNVRAGQFNDLELECLGGIAQGASIDELCASFSLTETQAHDILAETEMKLGAHNRMHAVILAIRLGILDGALK